MDYIHDRNSNILFSLHGILCQEGRSANVEEIFRKNILSLCLRQGRLKWRYQTNQTAGTRNIKKVSIYKVSSTYVQKILYKNVQLFWLSDIVLYPVWATINTNYMWMVKDSIQYVISYHSIIKYAIPIRKVYICS